MDEQAGLAASGHGAGKKQLRQLADFSIYNAEDPQQLVGLESLHQKRNRSKPVASGTLFAADGALVPGAQPVSVVTGPVVDWCLQYGDTPAIWILTRAAWYCLGKPCAEYSSTFEAVQLRLELATRCAGALAADPTAAAGVVRHRVLNGLVAGSNGAAVHPQQLSEAAEFLAAQMAALHQAGSLLSQPFPGASAADVLPFVGWLKQEGAAIAAPQPATKKQRVGEGGQAAVAAAADALSQQPRQTTAPSSAQPTIGATAIVGASPASAPTFVSEQSVPAVVAAAHGQLKPAHKLKISMPGSNLKPKFKLKGQILPQSQPPPQDMGSEIQGTAPGLNKGQAAHKPKLKFVMPKVGLKQHQEVQQQQLQHQESWQFSDAQGGWGPPPPYPPSAPHGVTQQQRHYDYSAYDYYDEAAYSQQQHHQTARQQQRAAAAAAKQAAVEAKAAAAAARAEEQARRHQQRLLQLEVKRQAEITADIARGAPPAPTRTFRLPADYVCELLMVWELCQAFGGVLNIPPFSLDQLEAALLPGPLGEQQQQQSASVTGAMADAEALKVAQAAAAQLAAQLAEAAAAAEKAAAGEEQGAADLTPCTAAAAAQASRWAQQPAAARQQPTQPAPSGSEQDWAAAEQQAAVHQIAADTTGAPPAATGAAAAAQASAAAHEALVEHVSVPLQAAADKTAAAGKEQPAGANAIRPAGYSGSCDGAGATGDKLAPDLQHPTAAEVAATPAAGLQNQPAAYGMAAHTASDKAPAAVNDSTLLQQTAEPASTAVGSPAADSDHTGQGLASGQECSHVAPSPAAEQQQLVGFGPESLAPATSRDVSGTAAEPLIASEDPKSAAAASTPGKAAEGGADAGPSVVDNDEATQTDEPAAQKPQLQELPQLNQLQDTTAQEQQHGQLPAVDTGTAGTAHPQEPLARQVQLPGQHLQHAEEQLNLVDEPGNASGDTAAAAAPTDQQHVEPELWQADIAAAPVNTAAAGAMEILPYQQSAVQGQADQQLHKHQQQVVPQLPADSSEQQPGLKQNQPLQSLPGQQQGQQQAPEQQPSQQAEQPLQPQQQPQTPFANHQPAPSTTSVGTGQAAASISAGAAPSPAKQKLKFKVKLSGALKSSSSQLQQAASGITASAATDPIAVDPTTATVTTVVDPNKASGCARSGLAPGTTVAAAAAQEDEVQQQQQLNVGITDPVNMASSLILRDIHSALLRLVDGTALKPGKKPPKQPLVAKLCPGDTNQRHLAALMVQPHWTHRVAYAVSAAAGTLLTSSDFQAQEVSGALLNSDYAVMPLHLRMSALRCLLELALASDTFKAHLDVRMETYSAPKMLRAEVFRAFSGVLGTAGTGQRGRPKGSGYGGGGYGGSQQLIDGPSDDEKRGAVAAAEKSIGGRMIDEWMEWISQQEQQSSGTRRPLGVDFRGQQYWVLGGAAGAWRVFVEQQEGILWGFYEGEQLLRLTNWLACAAIEAEFSLLHTLCAMPWPYRPNLVLTALSGTAAASAAAAGGDPPESPGSIAYWANVACGSGSSGYQSANSYAFGYCFTPVEAGVESLGPLVMAVGMRLPAADQLMGQHQMQRLRPDGYRKLCAPLMMGEAGVPGGSVLNSAEERIQAAIGSLVAVLFFWLKQQQQHILQQLGHLMDSLLVADSPAAYCSAVLLLESLLAHPQVKPVPLTSVWAADWQQSWRDSLAATGPDSWEAVSLHLSMLGRFAVVDEYKLGRDAFMRTVTNSRCSLVFPAVGDVFMFSRSGCLRHLDKYIKLPPSVTAPLPPAAEELSASAAAIKQLPPMSCYRVVAVAYRSYPMSEVLKQQQQQVAAAAAVDTVAVGDDDADGATVTAGAAAAFHGGSAAAATATAAVSESGLSDDWPGLATLGDDGAEDVESLLAFDEDELDIDTLPGQINQQRQHPPHHNGHHHHPHHQQHQGPGQQQQHQQQSGGGPAVPALGAAADGAAAADAPRRDTALAQINSPGSPEYRPPCMWVLMSPVDLSSSKADDYLQSDIALASRDHRRPYIAVPFHVDEQLPDFLVPVDVYESAVEPTWLPGDKFSMYFGGRPGQKTGGHYCKGSIVNVDEGQDRDPWCSIEVLWEEGDGDDNQHTTKHKVSPWDIEPDRDEVRKKEEAARRHQQAAAAAEEVRRQEEAAAEARARRRSSRAVTDYSDLIGAVDDDDEYNPLAEGYSSDSDGGRRRRRKGKRGRGSDDEDFRDSAAPGAGEGGGKKSRKFKPAWSLDQIKQQQNRHLNGKQQQMLGAMSTGNTLLLARLTSAPPNAPIHEQPFPVPLRPEVLAAVPHEGFPPLIADYNTSARGKFVHLMWNQKELDMYALFMVVNARGGYEAVCRNNKWVDVCRAMGGPSDPDSGSNMRSNYERVLVEFEQYVRCGRWEQDMAAGKPPKAEKSDTDAAFEQVMRAGAAAAAAPPPPPPPPPVAAAPGLGIAGLGLRPQFLAGATGGLMPGVGLQPGTTAIVARNAAGQPVLIQATPQQLLALQLAQQQQLLLAEQQARPGAPSGAIMLPTGLPMASGPALSTAPSATTALPTASASAQQQLLLRQQLLQQAQLQSAAASAAVKVVQASGTATNPQLRALLQQPGVTAAIRPAAAAATVQLPGGLTMQQLQALQAQQLKAAGSTAGAAIRPPAAAAGGPRPATSLIPAASLALPPRPPSAPAAPAGGTSVPATSSAGSQQALAGTGSMNFSALLDDLV